MWFDASVPPVTSIVTVPVAVTLWSSFDKSNDAVCPFVFTNASVDIPISIPDKLEPSPYNVSKYPFANLTPFDPILCKLSVPGKIFPANVVTPTMFTLSKFVWPSTSISPLQSIPLLAVITPTESTLITSSYVNVPPILTLPVKLPVVAFILVAFTVVGLIVVVFKVVKVWIPV